MTETQRRILKMALAFAIANPTALQGFFDKYYAEQEGLGKRDMPTEDDLEWAMYMLQD